MEEVKLIDNAYYSIGFPTLSSEIIRRDNLLSEIEKKLHSGARAVFIKGDEDSGKTTLCAQLAKHYPDTSITVFFNPLNTLDYRIEYYYINVIAQIKFIVDGVENVQEDSLSAIGFEEYYQAINRFRNFLKRRNKKAILIIDGLENKTNTEKIFLKTLLQLVPFGDERFSIVITGNVNEFIGIDPTTKDIQSESVSIYGFSELEISKYLEINSFNSSDIKDLFKITNGLPGRLRTLKRLMDTEGYTLSDITASTTYKSWIELDCNRIDLEKPIINAIISLVSLSNNTYSIKEISEIFNVDVKTVEQVIKDINLLKVEPKITFVSGAHKRYLSNLLYGNKKKISEALINYYTSVKTVSSMIELPKLFEEMQSWQKVIELFNEEYLPEILENTGSKKFVTDSLEIGLKATERMAKYSEMLKYSLQGALVNELDSYLFWESEIEARIALQDFYGAIALAESAILKVDRLMLLSVIAKRQKELSKDVDEALISTIQGLYKEIDVVSIGSRIYDIVANLIYAIPNLALEIIERSTKTKENEEKNINDWVVAKLSVAAISSSLNEDGDIVDSKSIDALKILNNPSVDKISKAISFLVANYTPEKVLDEVKKLNDPLERLKLLRLWLNNTIGPVKGLDIVIEESLKELVSASSESSITINHLKDLSAQLYVIEDIDRKRLLIRQFSDLEKSIPNIGSSKDKYIFKLNIFHARFTFDLDYATKTIAGIIKEIDSIDDPLIKIEALAEVYAKLKTIKHYDFKNFFNGVYKKILLLARELFTSTANHFEIIKYTIKTIGKVDPTFGIQICNEMNTKLRRERGKAAILNAYLENDIKHVHISVLKELEFSFEYSYSQSNLYAKTLEKFSSADNLSYGIVKELLYFLSKIEAIKNKEIQLESYIFLYKIICKNQIWKQKLEQKLLKAIESTLNQIEQDWDRIDNGFFVCSEVAKLNSSFAKKIFTDCENLKDTSWLDSRPIAYAFLNSLKITIKAYGALLVSKKDSDKDYRTVETLIARVPSELEMLRLWTEVGFNALLAENEPICKKILSAHIYHLLDGLLSKRQEISSAINSITLIHVISPIVASDYITKLPIEYHEFIFSNICEFYTSRRNPFENYDDDTAKPNNKYEYMSNAVEVLKQLTTDSSIYYYIKNICKVLAFNKGDSLSSSQVVTLIGKLTEICELKLPDKVNIKHNGFQIISLVRISKLKKGENLNTLWNDIFKSTELIPNLSDRVFIRSILLEEFPYDRVEDGHNKKKKIFEDILNELNEFKVHYEFVQRVIDICEPMYKFNKNRWKETVQAAFSATNKFSEGQDEFSTKKSLIDSMYRLDPSFARELVKAIDDENKEAKINKLLNEHMEMLEMSNKIKNSQPLEEKERENHEIIIKGLYQAIKSLNSGKIPAKKIADFSKYLPFGVKVPLHEGFPIYTFYFLNCCKTYTSNKTYEGTVENIHIDNFNEAVTSTSFVEVLSRLRKNNSKRLKRIIVKEEFSGSKAIHPGTREEAFKYIREWIQQEIEDFVIIADPYFQKEDLEIVKIINEISKEVAIYILGSKGGSSEGLDNEFKSYWKSISDEFPPHVKFTFCWMPGLNNQTPFHDRCIITKNGGLSLGTSLNSIGVNKESGIINMTIGQAQEISQESLMEYILMNKRKFNNENITYRGFTL